MIKEDFNLLSESLQQAIAYKKGNKKAARCMARDHKAVDIETEETEANRPILEDIQDNSLQANAE